MAGHRSYLRRLDRRHSGKGERCSRQKSLHVISRCSGIHPLLPRIRVSTPILVSLLSIQGAYPGSTLGRSLTSIELSRFSRPSPSGGPRRPRTRGTPRRFARTEARHLWTGSVIHLLAAPNDPPLEQFRS
jgi:hypothetical protein